MMIESPPAHGLDRSMGRNRISPMSTSSGRLRAKTAARAKVSVGIDLLA